MPRRQHRQQHRQQRAVLKGWRQSSVPLQRHPGCSNKRLKPSRRSWLVGFTKNMGACCRADCSRRKQKVSRRKR